MSDPRFARDQLRAFVERVERLEEEIKTLNDDKRDIYAEAKGNGFDVQALKAVVAYRRKDSDKLKEFEAIFDTYMHALGIGTDNATRARAEERRPPSLGAAATPPESKSVADSSALKPVGDGESGPERPPGPDSTISDDIPAFLRRPLQQEAGQ